MPAGSKILPYRSNIPKISTFCFVRCDPDFPERAQKAKKGIILGGSNYGQGSSREHAALAPLYLGIKAVIAKSFARIHYANLVNNGILPLILDNTDNYNKISFEDNLSLPRIREEVAAGAKKVTIINKTNGATIMAHCDISNRQRDMLLAGGLINLIRNSTND